MLGIRISKGCIVREEGNSREVQFGADQWRVEKWNNLGNISDTKVKTVIQSVKIISKNLEGNKNS